LRRAPAEDASLEAVIKQAGDCLAPSARSGHIREAFLGKVATVRLRNARALESDSRARARGRLLPAFGAVALAAVVAIALIGGLGLASLHAMPGAPLYSMKRAVENTRVAFSGGEARVNMLLDHADSRLGELEYVKSQGMGSWSAALARDAKEEVSEAKLEASRLGAHPAGAADQRAARIVTEHQGSLRESIPSMPATEQKTIERWVDDETHESPAPQPESHAPEGHQGVEEHVSSPVETGANEPAAAKQAPEAPHEPVPAEQVRAPETSVDAQRQVAEGATHTQIETAAPQPVHADVKDASWVEPREISESGWTAPVREQAVQTGYRD